jgi:hypothetical protein
MVCAGVGTPIHVFLGGSVEVELNKLQDSHILLFHNLPTSPTFQTFLKYVPY